MQKPTRLQRLLAVVVAVFMVICCLPLNAFAEGDNAEANYIAPVCVTFEFKDNVSNNKVAKDVTKTYWSTGRHYFRDDKDVMGAIPSDYSLANENDYFKIDTIDVLRGKMTVVVLLKAKEQEKSIKVMFDNNGQAWNDGDSNNLKTLWLYSKTPSDAITAPDVATSEDMEFTGWSNNCSVPDGTAMTYEALEKYVVFDADNVGYITFTAQYRQVADPDAGKTLKIYWAINDPNGATWDLYGNSDPRTETIAWADRGNTFVMPKVNVKEGYELAGWNVSGNEGQVWGPDTYNFGLTGLIVEDENGGSVAITANIVKKEEQPTGKTLKINWSIDKGEGASWKLYDEKDRTETIAWDDRNNTFVMPELVINDGYELAGWTVSGKEANYWGADTKTFGLTGLIVEDENGGSVDITANIVKKEDVANKTLKIHWAIDNADAASWKLYDGNARTETIAWSDRGNTFVMPELNIAEGYELAGWSVSGTQGNYWDANTYNFGLTGLIVEDEEGGYVSITANVVKKDSKTLRVTWNIDNPEAANWKLYDGNTRTETFAWDDRDNTMVMPELEIADGYMLKGWTVDGQTLEVWNPNLETVCLKDKYVEDEHGAHIFITANIVKKDADDDDSSSDSSSNNNTTATVTSTNSNNNNTQVVKAEAPADNTAKVMPQTGLTAETPVVFGVMMVAALAGAGAYLFAIRKKLN